MARRRSQRDEILGYSARISDWDFYYSFSGVDPKSRWEAGPFSELTTLSFTGTLLLPENFKYPNVTVTLSAQAGLLENRPFEETPSIGSISGGGSQLEAYIFVPRERIAELAVVAHSGKVQRINFSGTKLRYRRGIIYHMSLATNEDEEE